MYNNGRISVSQLFIWMVIYFTAASSASNLDILFARQDALFSNLLAILPGILTAYLIFLLQKKYPGFSLFEISEEALGKWPGKIVNLIFVYFALEACIFYARTFGEFIITTLTPELSIDMYLMCIVLVGAIGVYYGIEAIARVAQLLFPFYVLLTIIINVLLIRQFEVDHILPLLDHKAGEIIYSSFLPYVFPMGEVIFFMIVFPYVKQSKQLFKAAAGSLILAGMFLAYRAMVSIGVLGQGTALASNFPFFNAIRLVKIGEFIERIDILFLGIFVMAVLLQIITVYYFLSHGVAHLFHLKEMKSLLIPIAILVYALARVTNANIVDITHYLMFTRIVTGPIYMILLPALLLVMSMVRKPRNTNADLSPSLEK